MKEQEFEKLLRDRENKDLDFKLDLPKSGNVAELVTALYNSRGGKIILGVDDDRNPIGLKDPQGVEHKFTQIIRYYCKLDEDPGIEFVRYMEKDFIVIHCPKGRNTPCLVKNQLKPRIRTGSSNMPANKEEIARLYREGSTESQDIYPVKNATLDDLNLRKIRKYFKESRLTVQLKGKYFHDLLKKENFVVEENGKLTPTAAGVLLFGKPPQVSLSCSTILADRYQGVDMIRWIDKRELDGTIFELIDKAEKFFLENMRTAAWSKGFKTIHRTEYPIEALKEAVVNALAHRDYFFGENILIRMFDDRVEILSPGELLRPLTIKQLEDLTYDPKSRNRTIVDVLMRRRLMDKRGTGIIRMNNFMKGWGLEKPTFRERTGYFTIIFRGPGKPVLKVPDERLRGLNERQIKALRYIEKGGEITRKEYEEINSTSKRTAIRDLKGLVNKAIIREIGKGPSMRYVLI